jgi:hypothetical protein
MPQNWNNRALKKLITGIKINACILLYYRTKTAFKHKTILAMYTASKQSFSFTVRHYKYIEKNWQE